MATQDYTTSFLVEQSPEQVYAAVNNVRGWWTGDIDGGSENVGDAFTYRYEDLHRSVQRVTELVPGKKVVWHVDDADISFVQDQAEWTGTDIVFDIAQKDGKTELRFTHVGLVPQIECYSSCSDAWGYYVNSSLRNYIAKSES
jgi:Activator of Hsp90 ATPase homolog 1-like protein